MALFMDMHTVEGATAEDVAGAHAADLATQGAYGVQYLKYWHDESTGRIFCLAEGPDRETVDRVHREAHGLTAEAIFEVVERS